MTTDIHASRAFQALLISSLGLLVFELLRPVEAQAESCTLDPLGGEVCLPEEDPDDDEDDERDVSKKSKGDQETKSCSDYSPVLRPPHRSPSQHRSRCRNPPWNRHRLNRSAHSG